MGSRSPGIEDLADDGKRFDALDVATSVRRMTGSALTRWTLQLRSGGLKGGSLREGVGSGFSGIEDLADDGKRLDALDVVWGTGGCKGRESEGGEWVSDFTGPRDLADDGKRSHSAGRCISRPEAVEGEGV